MERINTILDRVYKLEESLKPFFIYQAKACQDCEKQGYHQLLSKREVMDILKIVESTYYEWVKIGILKPRGPRRDMFFKCDIKEVQESRGYRERMKAKPQSKKK